MAKRLTVFYSWQSDTPSNLNRTFIEKALLEALKRLHSDATLENALRDTTVELDKDTKGVAGSPPIAETILKKIDDCAVFVADVTFVGESKAALCDAEEKPRQFPNPNVMLEYGYALKRHSHAALIAVMNTAFGKPDGDLLPFDLRHLRWPITYHLPPSSESVQQEFGRLCSIFVDALRLILVNHTDQSVLASPFIPQKHNQTNPAFFFDDADDLIPRSALRRSSGMSLSVPSDGVAYLRLQPPVSVPEIETELDAEKIAIDGGLIPMGRVSGWGRERNVFGTIIYEMPKDFRLYHFSQLFLSKEIWGIDALCLNAEISKQFSGQDSGYIASAYLEEVFLKITSNYLSFAKSHLKLPLPLRIEAGLFGVKGYSIVTGSNNWTGNALQDHIAWRGEVTDYGLPASEVIEPFFKRVWSKCGVERVVAR